MLRQGILPRAFSLRQFSTSGLRLNQSVATWNEFFALRNRRRRLGQVCSAFTTVGALGAAWSYFANIEIDMTENLFGVNVMVIYGAAIAFSGVAGYLAGPSLGNVIFSQTLGARALGFAAKERNFLQRIRINRPDPSKQSYINPVTDYYGEKIDSVNGYRRWLRDVHVYTRKSQKYI